jgi:hypothetical protein
LTVVLDESCLRRVVGNESVMRDQFQSLIDVSTSGRITFRILSFEAGAHQAMGFPFHIFTFDEGDPIVYVELLDRGEFLEDVGEVARYRSAFEQVMKKAYSPAQSRSFLKKMLGTTE